MRISIVVKAGHTARSVVSIERDDGSSGMSGLQVNETGWSADDCRRAFLLCPVAAGWTAFVVRTNARPLLITVAHRGAPGFQTGGWTWKYSVEICAL